MKQKDTMRTKKPIFIGFLVLFFTTSILSACNSQTHSTADSTSTTIDPANKIQTQIQDQVSQFIVSYIERVSVERPNITISNSTQQLKECVSPLAMQVVTSVTTSIVKRKTESLNSWAQRVSSAAMQSAQAIADGLISSCTNSK